MCTAGVLGGANRPAPDEAGRLLAAAAVLLDLLIGALDRGTAMVADRLPGGLLIFLACSSIAVSAVSVAYT